MNQIPATRRGMGPDVFSFHEIQNVPVFSALHAGATAPQGTKVKTATGVTTLPDKVAGAPIVITAPLSNAEA